MSHQITPLVLQNDNKMRDLLFEVLLIEHLMQYSRHFSITYRCGVIRAFTVYYGVGAG